jgi:antitoxin MazE
LVRVSRWGNSLAVRLPKDVVEELALKEGDEVRLTRRPNGEIEVERDRSREAAIQRIRTMSMPLPPGYRFDRNEIYDRGHSEPDRDA